LLISYHIIDCRVLIAGDGFCRIFIIKLISNKKTLLLSLSVLAKRLETQTVDKDIVDLRCDFSKHFTQRTMCSHCVSVWHWRV